MNLVDALQRRYDGAQDLVDWLTEREAKGEALIALETGPGTGTYLKVTLGIPPSYTETYISLDKPSVLVRVFDREAPIGRKLDTQDLGDIVDLLGSHVRKGIRWREIAYARQFTYSMFKELAEREGAQLWNGVYAMEHTLLRWVKSGDFGALEISGTMYGNTRRIRDSVRALLEQEEGL